jgi:RimJ/RimL family protein N-acetyltransferase
MNSENNWTKNVVSHEKLKSDMAAEEELNIPGLSKPFSLVEFAPKDASEKLWTAYFSISETIFREFNQGRRLPDREAVKRLISTTNPLYNVKRWIVLDETESAIASASLSYDTELSPDFETGSHICHIHIEVAPSYRRKKIATYLLKHLIKNASAMEKDTVRADADNAAGIQYCKFLKGKVIHKEVQHRLYLEDVDWQLVDQLRAKGKTRSLRTTIESFQECPDKDIEEFCRIYTEIINQRPVGDMQEGLITTPESRRMEEHNFKRRGTEWHTMISREDDRQISAMTDIMYKPQEPYKIHQYFTGVLGRYRRRGLAKRLKAEMLMYIKERFPEAEYIKTTTASENKPMRAINKQLGFMPKKTCYMFRWALQDLNRRLNKVFSASNRVSSSKRKPKKDYRKGSPL